MNLGGLFHPALLTALPGFTERITIEESIPVPDGAGEPVDHWSAVPGLIGIGASVVAAESVSLGEIPGPDGTPIIADYVAILDGLYPQITTRMRARWTIHGVQATPFTRGEFGDDPNATEIVCGIIRRTPTILTTALALREVIP